MKVSQKIMIALIDLMEGGETYITRYKIAKVAGVSTPQVYRFFSEFKKITKG